MKHYAILSFSAVDQEVMDWWNGPNVDIDDSEKEELENDFQQKQNKEKERRKLISDAAINLLDIYYYDSIEYHTTDDDLRRRENEARSRFIDICRGQGLDPIIELQKTLDNLSGDSYLSKLKGKNLNQLKRILGL